MMWVAYAMMFVLGLLSTLLIFVVLLQRGRGGGLAGALGGMGGQSAFGTKAGDVFTKITVILAMVWIVLAAASIPLMRYLAGNRFEPGTATPATITAPAQDKKDVKKIPDEPVDGDQEKGEIKAPVKKDIKVVPDDEAAKPESPDESKSEEGTKPAAETPAAEKAPVESKDEPKPEDATSTPDEKSPESPEK